MAMYLPKTKRYRQAQPHRAWSYLLLALGCLLLASCVAPAAPDAHALLGLAFAPAWLRLTAGASGRIQLTERLTDGTTRAVGEQASWAVANPAVAQIGPGGQVRALSVGETTISATLGGQSISARLQVLAPLELLRPSSLNPRYFANERGRAVYLTGAHTWANLQDYGESDPPPAFDYPAFLDAVQAQNHSFFRLWAWEQARWLAELPGDFWFDPLPYQRPGPGLARDGKPKFDLAAFNPAYFERLRQRVIAAGERGFYVSVMLFNGWSIEDKAPGLWRGNPWPGHPFHRDNNINGVDGDLNGDGQGRELHSLAHPAITALQEAYVRKVIDTIGDLDNVLYEISNESDPGGTDWQYHMIALIKEYEAGRPKQHPVGMSAEWPDGDNAALFASQADWIAPNPAINGLGPAELAKLGKVIMADTDHLCGICGERAWVWQSFLQGFNFMFMDPYDEAGVARGVGPENKRPPNDPAWVDIRRAMGETLAYAQRMNLAAATPRAELSTTGYCLANTAGGEYLVYAPQGGEFSVDLSGAAGQLAAEWLNPRNGEIVRAGTVAAGARASFHAPFEGDAVLFLH